MHPDLIQDWWTEELASNLQDFYDDLKAGKRPKLGIMSPPQHGKTRTVEDFICCATGRDPNMRTIYASYSDELGVRMNQSVQRTLESDRYLDVFGRIAMGLSGYQCNTSMIELSPWRGSFRNVTINGGVTSEKVGSRAYALYSRRLHPDYGHEPGTMGMNPAAQGLVEHRETIDIIGDVSGHQRSLKPSVFE